jgi:hypothetical protein
MSWNSHNQNGYLVDRLAGTGVGVKATAKLNNVKFASCTG